MNKMANFNRSYFTSEAVNNLYHLRKTVYYMMQLTTSMTW